MGKLFAVVLTIITLVSAGLIAAHVWWLPVDISTIGPRIDRQMDETMVATGVLFLSSQLILACFVWKFGDKRDGGKIKYFPRSEEHTSELQSRLHLVCRLLLENKKLTLADSLVTHFYYMWVKARYANSMAVL